MINSKYENISYKCIYHKKPWLIFTRRRYEHMGVSNTILGELFYLCENWRCNYKTTVWFQDYMRKPCIGNSHKIVGKKNIRLRRRI